MTDDELKALFEAMTGRFDHTADRIATENRDFFTEAADRITAENRDYFTEAADRITTENREFFTEAADRITAENREFFRVEGEALRHDIQLVAEGVTATREALDREAADIRQEVRRTAAETQAMIKFSHAELDRRVTRLEDAMSDLQARVERLEGSTH